MDTTIDRNFSPLIEICYLIISSFLKVSNSFR